MTSARGILKAFAPYQDLEPDGVLRFDLRRKLIARFGFAIPSVRMVDFIVARCGGSLLEVGAGTGYLSALVADRGGRTTRGVDVIATDASTSATAYKFRVGAHFEVERGIKAATAIRQHPGRAVLMSWPCYGKRWAAAAARSIQPGGLLFYIGESIGGCCANDEFFRLLEREFERADGCGIPTWPGLHDHSIVLHQRNSA